MAAVKEIILRCVRTVRIPKCIPSISPETPTPKQSSLVLDIIYERAPRVFKVYFWDCCFLVSPRAKITSFEALRLLLPRACISHSSSKIIAVDYEQILSWWLHFPSMDLGFLPFVWYLLLAINLPNISGDDRYQFDLFSGKKKPALYSYYSRSESRQNCYCSSAVENYRSWHVD